MLLPVSTMQTLLDVAPLLCCILAATGSVGMTAALLASVLVCLLWQSRCCSVLYGRHLNFAWLSQAYIHTTVIDFHGQNHAPKIC